MEFAQSVIEQLREAARDVDLNDSWPGRQLAWLADAGVHAWSIPAEYGGREATAHEYAHAYRRMASACLLTTFVWSQRNAAVGRLVESGNDALKANLLPSFASGEQLATVGISHLSTSRQHTGKPAVFAVERAGGYELNGVIPWVTGGGDVDQILVGATLNDGTQLLGFLSPHDKGVEVLPHGKLLALTGSHTGPIELKSAFLPTEHVVAGPVEKVMQAGSGGTGSVTTSALAIGLAERCVTLLQEEAGKRSDLDDSANSLQRELDEVIAGMDALTLELPDTDWTSAGLRERANSLALRSAQAYLTAVKGAGFVKGHVAERSIREAMFFLVWSCPQPVAASALREFACLGVE